MSMDDLKNLIKRNLSLHEKTVRIGYCRHQIEIVSKLIGSFVIKISSLLGMEPRDGHKGSSGVLLFVHSVFVSQ